MTRIIQAATKLALGAWLAIAAVGQASAADAVADFYKGKQITILVGSAVGGGYDAAARIAQRHWSKYIPGNPTIIVQNMPGAGGVTVINHVNNIAPKDGLTIAVPQSGSALEPIQHLLSPGGDTAKFDGTKLNWLGSVESGVYLFAFWHTSPIKTFEDLKTNEVLAGASAPNTDEGVFSNLLNNLFGTKLKIITGYGSAPLIALAIERGELQGSLQTYSSLMVKQPTWIKENKIVIPIQLTLTPYPPLGNVPMGFDLLKNDDDKRVLEVVLAKSKLARPFLLGEGNPPERVAALRTSFMAMLKDPDFVAEATKAGLNVDPVPPDEVQKVVERVYATPAPLLKRVREMIGGME